jgi:BirA family transcriptional regulator, biotin operon repressor / biotin---[acetyl-CoA-carboxylase] ligase
MSAAFELIELDVVDSTQDEVRVRLQSSAPGCVVAVSARSQRDGRGREGRTWQDPPGEALMLSIGVRGPLATLVLQDLPRRVVQALLDAIVDGVPGAAGQIAWKAPNDLVARKGGAKLGGVLVDARTTGASVDQLIVGIGLNLDGPAFHTSDGRRATSIAACTQAALPPDIRTRLATAACTLLAER